GRLHDAHDDGMGTTHRHLPRRRCASAGRRSLVLQAAYLHRRDHLSGVSLHAAGAHLECAVRLHRTQLPGRAAEAYLMAGAAKRLGNDGLATVISVNSVEIPERDINIESGNYEGGNIEERQHHAAVALVVRELLRQRADELEL